MWQDISRLCNQPDTDAPCDASFGLMVSLCAVSNFHGTTFWKASVALPSRSCALGRGCHLPPTLPLRFLARSLGAPCRGTDPSSANRSAAAGDHLRHSPTTVVSAPVSVDRRSTMGTDLLSADLFFLWSSCWRCARLWWTSNFCGVALRNAIRVYMHAKLLMWSRHTLPPQCRGARSPKRWLNLGPAALGWRGVFRKRLSHICCEEGVASHVRPWLVHMPLLRRLLQAS